MQNAQTDLLRATEYDDAACNGVLYDRNAAALYCSKKVLYLINLYPAVSHTFIRREILALEKLGLTIVRVAARPGAGLVDPADVDESMHTSYLLKNPFRLIGNVAAEFSRQPVCFAKAFFALCGIMRHSDRSYLRHLIYFVQACRVASIARKSDVSHIHAHFGTNPAELALLASRLSGVPYSFTVHGCDEYDKPEFLALKNKIREAAFVACVSHYGRAQLYRWCEQYDRHKVNIIRCGLDFEYNQDAQEVKHESMRFICVGRLCREKSQDILLDASAMLAAMGRRFEVVIVGDGNSRQELERRIENLGLASIVRLTGSLSNADVRDEILNSRALIVPSLAENLPVVIMEAMALRRPVIATQIAGIPELVKPDETGWLVDPGSPESLMKAMEICLETPIERIRTMGEFGRARVLRDHDVEIEAKKLATSFS